jgi:cobalt/nickel transport protein
MPARVTSSRSMAATLKSKPRAAAGLLGGALAGLATTAAEAHFQLLYTAEAALNESAPIELALVFSHPFDNGYTMDMGTPEALYVVSQRGESEPRTTDLMQYLEPIEWSGVETKAAAFIARPPRTVTRSLGDYTFVLRPAPYYEEQEDKYIQQITKTVVNIGGLPGAWDEPLGLPVEIVPLDKPYANWVGGVFRAVVLADGKPVPHAEVEVEFLNHEPQIAERRFDPAAKVTAPQDSFKTLSIRADAAGQIIIGLPKAGWWGICALDLDDGARHEGKELSVDAVLWIKAADMK